MSTNYTTLRSKKRNHTRGYWGAAVELQHNEGAVTGRRQLMLRLPDEVYQWMHETSVLVRRSKAGILAEAITWAQALDNRNPLREVAIPEGARYATSIYLPQSLYLWVRIESAKEHWSANEFATRILLAWRRSQ